MSLRTILYQDLARQYFYAGQPDKQPTFGRLVWASFSPRFLPVLLFRLSHWFYQKRLSPFAKVLSLVNFVLFGLEIAVRCEISPGLYFPHTQGTVIGALRIGANATIYHNVTFGAREIDVAYSGAARPVVGDDVIVGAGAKVLGGITIGDGARIGANAVVIDDVPAGATVGGVPARIVKQSSKL